MRKTIFILVSILTSYNFVFAEKINKQMVELQTLKNSSSIMEAKLALDNAEQEYKRSLGAFLPEIGSTVGTGQSGGEGESKKTFTRSYSYGLNGSLCLFSGFGDCNEVKIHAIKVKIQEARYKRAVSDALYESNERYINLMSAYEKVELLKEIRKKRIENKGLINLKYHSGNVDIGSLKKEEVDVLVVEYDLRSAQRYTETASASLLVAIGRNADATILETDERIVASKKVIQKPDYNNLISTIPEFLIARYDVETCKFEKAKINNHWLPLVKVSGDISKTGAAWVPKHDAWSAGITFSYPIFNGGKRYYDSKKASNDLQCAYLKLTTKINSLKSQAIEHYNNLIDAHEIIDIETNNLSVSKLQSEISTKKFVNGFLDYPEWSVVERAYINAQIDLLDRKKKAALAIAKWHKFIGDDFMKVKEEQK